MDVHVLVWLRFWNEVTSFNENLSWTGASASAFFNNIQLALRPSPNQEVTIVYIAKTGFTTYSSNDLRSSKEVVHFACLVCCQFIVFSFVVMTITCILRFNLNGKFHMFMHFRCNEISWSIRKGSIRLPLGLNDCFPTTVAFPALRMWPCESLKHPQQSVNNMYPFWTPRASHWHLVLGNMHAYNLH